MSIFCLNSFAQNRTITGVVLNSKGESVIGASVKVLGSSLTRAITNSEGNFSVVVSSSAKQLEVSYIGMQKQVVEIGTGKGIKVILVEESEGLNEVVVVGYGIVKKKDFTGSVSSVNGKTLSTTPVANIAQALQGKLSGVNVISQDGRPGASVSIRIRGGGSITQSNDPLILIDGIAASSISDIPSDQVESIDVLKDASSTAIYGARGANGVVLITTKRAKEGKTMVSYSSYVKSNTPVKYMDAMGPYDYLKYVWAETAAYGAAYQTPFEKLFGIGSNLGTNSGGIESYRNVADNNMQGQVYNNSVTLNHDFSIAGGNDKTKVLFAVNYLDDQGMKINSYLKRTGVSLKVDQKLSDNVDVSLDSRYTNSILKDNESVTSSTGSLLSYSYRFRPIATANILGDLTAMNSGNIGTFGAASLWDSYSPYARINSYEPLTTSQSLVNTASLNWKLFKNLRYHSDLTLRQGWGENKNWEGAVYKNYINATTGAFLYAGDATYQKSDSWGLRWSNTLSSDFKISQSSQLNILAGQEVTNSGGTFMQIYATKFPTNFTKDNAFAMINQYSSGGTATLSSGISIPGRLLSYFGRANYSLLDRYLATFTFRADGSSKFSTLHRWGYFPAGALAWRISEEPFLKPVKWVDNLKARLSFGSVGNDGISSQLWSQTWKAGTSTTYMYPLNHVSTSYYELASASMSNPDLKWETTLTRNLGIDFSVFNSRLSGTVDVYWNTTKDLLMQTSLPGITGFTSTYANIGQTSNKGIEVSLNGTIYKDKNWNISAGGNINFNKNNIDKLASNVTGLYGTYWASASTYPTYDYQLVVGKPVGQVRGFVYDGFYKTSDFDYANGVYTLKSGVADISTSSVLGVVHGIGTTERPSTQIAYPGLPKFKDISGANGTPDGKINEYDVTTIGDMNPIHTGGFNLNVSYKNLDLGAYFNWSYGNQLYNLNKLATVFGPKEAGVYENKLAIMNNAYKIYDIQNGQLVRLTTPDQLDAVNANATLPLSYNETCPTSSLAIEDGSYLRLNTLTLGYSLPKSILSKVKIDKLRFYGSIYNVFTLTAYSGLDPEVNVNSTMTSNYNTAYPTPGLDWGAYPRARSFVLGLNLNF
jgi:TonB-linked SusC/RagA family outer membrane protein